jgi:hypothetical protein
MSGCSNWFLVWRYEFHVCSRPIESGAAGSRPETEMESGGRGQSAVIFWRCEAVRGRRVTTHARAAPGFFELWSGFSGQWSVVSGCRLQCLCRRWRIWCVPVCVGGKLDGSADGQDFCVRGNQGCWQARSHGNTMFPLNLLEACPM